MSLLSLPSLIPLWVAALAAAIALLLGLGLGHWRRAKLRHELELAQQELKSQAHLEQEREHALALATERLSSAFGQLANQQFQSHSEAFLRLARENLTVHTERTKTELAERQRAIDALIRPISDALARTEQQLSELDKARRETHGAISAQLQAMAESQQALSAETRNLVNALRRPEVRGQWGEITLRRLVELAGMVEHCDFVSQSHLVTATGSIRPDMVIHLPENRQLVVDVKTPLDAYLEATEAPSEPERRAALERHAAIVAGRIRELAGKAYWAQFEASPDFVILFIPGDQFLTAALAERPTLLDDALRQNIILASPTSIIALLKAVAYGWQQVALAENAAELRGLAVQLYERLTTFTTHLANVGKALGDSVRAFNASVGSLERMVLPSARRFTDLGVQPKQRLGTLPMVEEDVREPVAGAASEPAEGPAPTNDEAEAPAEQRA